MLRCVELIDRLRGYDKCDSNPIPFMRFHLRKTTTLFWVAMQKQLRVLLLE